MLVFGAFGCIAALNLLTGYVTARHCFRTHPFEGLRVEWFFLIFALGALLNGWLAFTLAEWGRFSFGLWVGGIALYTLVAGGLLRRQPYAPPHFVDRPLPLGRWRLSPRWEYLLLAVWGVVAIALFFRPHQWIWGAADAGVYVNLGGYISQTGSLLIRDPVLADLDQQLYPAFLRTMQTQQGPSYFWSSGLIVPDTSGRILPPFYHLFPVWQAVAFTLLGIKGALWMTSFWMWWASTAVYLTLRRLLWSRADQWWLPAIGLAALTLCALQVWFARYPTTEALTQFLFWAGLWGFIAWGDTAYRVEPLGLLAGLAWGSTFLARIDTFFMLIIPALLFLFLLYRRQLTRAHLPFFALLVLLSLQATLHALFLTPFYFFTVFGYILLVARQNLWALGLAAVGTLALGAVLWRYAETLLGWVMARQRAGRILLILITLALFAYNWFVRPRWGMPLEYINPWDNVAVQQWNHENLIRLGWYLSPLGIALAAWGIGYLIWTLDSRTWGLLLLGAVYAVLYLWNIRSNAIQIYAMRRYVPVVVPFFICAVVLFLAWLHGRGKTWLVMVVSLVWLVNVGWQARGFVSHIDHAGAPAELAHIAAQFAPDSVILFNQANLIGIGDHVGVPLTLLYGHHAFVLHHIEALDLELFAQTLAAWQTRGHTVYWVQIPHAHDWPLAADLLQPAFAFDIPATQLETPYDHKPTQILTGRWPSDVYRVLPLASE